MALAPRDVPLGRPPGISQKSKIPYLFFELNKSRLLPTNLDPLNTILLPEKLSNFLALNKNVKFEQFIDIWELFWEQHRVQRVQISR